MGRTTYLGRAGNRCWSKAQDVSFVGMVGDSGHQSPLEAPRSPNTTRSANRPVSEAPQRPPLTANDAACYVPSAPGGSRGSLQIDAGSALTLAAELARREHSRNRDRDDRDGQRGNIHSLFVASCATPNPLIYSRRMARGVVYLLNFPDGRQTTLNRVGAGQAVEGTEIAPGWVINRMQLATGGSYTYEGFPISFEVWVEPKAPLDRGQ
jgi:hypothetical protein